ncbi:MAG: glutamate--tRNA ligase [Firmicutes bacterium]|jgi:glutamyl-tRNA synthetase|nr:glutamate--tRNA ligase [Bacillota bacterium]
MEKVRVRFAPSPTGKLHIGGARTALFNWLLARSTGGTFVLRIEDTDVERSTQASVDQIISSLKWLGLDWDEGPEIGGEYGPYFQSERLHLYEDKAQELIDKGKAYLCYCTPEELEAKREEARRTGRPPRYDGHCRNLSEEECARLAAEGRQAVIRLKVPETGETVVDDLIRGRVVFQNSILDDFIIIKSNGMPTYNYACVVDDHAMRLTHIIRAEEHLSNTPRQVLLYQALGYELPQFAHVPMILAPDRSKLSKRHGATSVEEFRDQGYLQEAIINYLALLGWSPEGTDEIMPLEDIVKQFSLERVSKNAAIYDTKKLTWINGYYLRNLPGERVVQETLPFLKRLGLIGEEPGEDELRLAHDSVLLTRDRAKTLEELADAVSYFFKDGFDYDEKGVQKHFSDPAAADRLCQARARLEALADFTYESIESEYRQLAEELGIKAAQLIHPTRLALSGRTIGPGLFELMALLGREKCLKRLERAIDFIGQRTVE